MLRCTFLKIACISTCIFCLMEVKNPYGAYIFIINIKLLFVKFFEHKMLHVNLCQKSLDFKTCACRTWALLVLYIFLSTCYSQRNLLKKIISPTFQNKEGNLVKTDITGLFTAPGFLVKTKLARVSKAVFPRYLCFFFRLPHLFQASKFPSEVCQC